MKKKKKRGNERLANHETIIKLKILIYLLSFRG